VIANIDPNLKSMFIEFKKGGVKKVTASYKIGRNKVDHVFKINKSGSATIDFQFSLTCKNNLLRNTLDFDGE
tara:strand:+ start:70 stop:285 length:216 start_codon:yes stop_codon:yes gene_type:complete